MALKLRRVLPKLKRGGYTARLRFLDEVRGERHFDTEFSVIQTDVPGRLILGNVMDHRGFATGPSAPSRLGTDLRPETVFHLSARRWTQIGQPRAVDGGMLRVVAVNERAGFLEIDLEPA